MENRDHLKNYLVPEITGEAASVIKSILDACLEISSFLRHSPIVKLDTSNLFGDEQLHQDLACDKIIETHLRRNSQVKGFASEENPFYN